MRGINHLRSAALMLVLLACAGLNAQSKSTLEDQGYDYLNAQDFVRAYEVFDKLHNRYPKEMDYLFKLGICALNYTEKKSRAIEIFKEFRDKKPSSEADLYLAKAYHRNYKFDEALVILQPLIEKLEAGKNKEDKELIPDTKLAIRHCVNGNFLVKEMVEADIVNVGPPINTHELEAVPLITADESKMIYTYVGRNSIGGKLNAEMRSDPNGMYLSDIYMSLRDSAGTGWMKAEPVLALCTKGNDAAIAMSPDGNQLFIFLSNNENEGDLLVSNFDGKTFSPPTPLNSNINHPEFWEGSCSITADGKHLYFSSERPGGLGGRDIWVSDFVDGDWGPAVNLGPKINTEYDDDAPFIHPDGVTLFFSSKGHTSIGGYDIMFSIREGEEWGEVKSMGVPLNTTEDDSYYVINSRGDKGYFSSTRTGSGGFGSHDIYMVTPGILGQKPIVAMLTGTVFGDDKPIEAKIEVVTKADDAAAGNFSSAKETGKYLVTFSPGKVYRIKVNAEGYKGVEEDFDLTHLDRFVEQNRDFFLYSDPAIAARASETTVPLAAVTPTAPANEPLAEKKTEAEPEKEPVKEPEKEPVVVKEPEKEPAKEPVLAKAEPEKEKKKQPAAKTKKLKKEAPVKEEEQPEEPEVAFTEPPPTPCGSSMPELKPLKGKSLNDPAVYRQLLETAGTYCADNLEFRVQVGAYRHPENFKPKKIEKFGTVASAPFPDGITRFTQKQYRTLADAEKHRQRVIARGIKDAWIVAYVGDKRYTLEDFIMVDFLSGPVN